MVLYFRIFIKFHYKVKKLDIYQERKQTLFQEYDKIENSIHY